MSERLAELAAIQAVHDALEPLDTEARTRVLTYIASLLSIKVQTAVSPAVAATREPDEGTPEDEPDESMRATQDYLSFAELYAHAQPKNNAERALVAGYWLQVCQGADSFTAAEVNRELTNLGHRIGHITDAINSMKKRTPMLMLQLKKKGISRQARKLHKISHEGIKRVEEMIGG